MSLAQVAGAPAESPVSPAQVVVAATSARCPVALTAVTAVRGVTCIRLRLQLASATDYMNGRRRNRRRLSSSSEPAVSGQPTSCQRRSKMTKGAIVLVTSLMIVARADAQTGSPAM